MIFFDSNIDKIVERIKNKSKIGRYIQFLFGCLIVAISFNLFLSPNRLVSGGVSGLSIILNSLFGFDKAVIIFLLSMLLLVLS